MGELNQHNLQYYIDKYSTKVFAETGTGKAFGFMYAMTFPFEKLFTVEINDELYKSNVARIKDPRCNLLFNNSLTGLKEILVSADSSPILFWLDAHFPGADFKLGSYEDEHPRNIKYPLETELKLILSSRKDNKDVFIIDDLQLYEVGDYQLKIDEDFLTKHRSDGKFVYELFADTHDIAKDFRHQGFWIITPKV